MPAYQGYQGATTSTPQEIARTRKLAEALMSEATDASPVQHWTQGLARVVKGGVGGYQAGQAGRMELAGQQAGSSSLAKALAGGSMEDAASGLMANPYMAQSGMDMATKVIGNREAQARAAQQAQDQFNRQKQLLDYRQELSRKDPMTAAELAYKQAQTAKLQREANAGPGSNTPQARAQMAQQYGLAPGSEAFKRFVLTGQLSDKGVSGGDDQDLARNVAAGIDKLARVPTQFDQSTFENAVGPYQGAEDGGIVGGIARTLGSLSEGVTNFGGTGYTQEVRNVIAGDTEALAAAIKPLIRAPGEGPWTDSDQKRLVAVVGNLAQARNADEYRRALEGVRERVMFNFNIPLPPIGGASQQQAPATGPSPYSNTPDDELMRGLGISP